MIQMYHVHMSYGPDSPGLVDVTLRIDKAEFVFVTGASGAGKTSLLRLIMLAERTAAWLGIDDGVSRTFETISDPEGNFELKVDPGLYDLTFIPPPASGLPRLLHEDIIITDQDEEMTRASTTLPRPKVIQGNVFNHGGNPMCGVTVDVYRSDETEATLIGQAMSYIDDEGKCDGAFSMVVPSNP